MSVQYYTDLLCKAAKTGNVEEVKRLIPLSDPKDRDSVALRTAATLGHTECVKLLIPVSRVFSEALRWAAHNGHVRCVELLISETHPKNGNQELIWAAGRGHTECVKLLIPISDPKEYNSRALQLAAINGYTQCVELLYPVSDPMVALKQLQHDYPDDYNIWGKLHEMVEAEYLQNTLNSEIETTAAVKVQRKM